MSDETAVVEEQKEVAVDPETPSEEPVAKKNGKPKKVAPKAAKAPTPKPAKVVAKTKVSDSPIYEGANKAEVKQAAALLKLASDATRLQILALVDGDRTVTDLTAIAKMSQPALSHHLALLRASGAVLADRDGKNNKYYLTKSGKTLLKAAKIIVASFVGEDDED